MAIKINGDNTVANPGFSGDDTDTGLQVGTNELKLVTGGSEAVTVDSSQNVGIGTSSPDEKLHISASNSAIGTDWTNARNLIRIEDVDTTQATNQITGGIVFEGNDSDNPGVQAGIFVRGGSLGGGDITFHTASNSTTLDGTESPRMMINRVGDVGVGTSSPATALDVNGEVRASTGVLFGTDTAAVNTLDDYEEGTWTPTILGASTAGTYTYSGQLGIYTKIGNTVNASCYIHTITTSSAGSGALRLAGLPFTVQATTAAYPHGPVRLNRWNVDDNTVNITCNVVNNSDQLQFVESRDNTSASSIQVTDKASDSAYIMLTIIYQAA